MSNGKVNTPRRIPEYFPRTTFPTGDVTIIPPLQVPEFVIPTIDFDFTSRTPPRRVDDQLFVRTPPRRVDPQLFVLTPPRRVDDQLFVRTPRRVDNSDTVLYSNPRLSSSPSSAYSLSFASSGRSPSPSPMAVAAVSEEAGTCICKLANGRNCGRVSKPGSFYCGIHKNGCRNGYTTYARRLGLDQNAIAEGGFVVQQSPLQRGSPARVVASAIRQPLPRVYADDGKESPIQEMVLPITQQLLARSRPTSPPRSPIATVVTENRVPIARPVSPIAMLVTDEINVLGNGKCQCRVKAGHKCGRNVRPGSDYCGLHRNGCTYGTYGKKSRRAKKTNKISQRKK